MASPAETLRPTGTSRTLIRPFAAAFGGVGKLGRRLHRWARSSQLGRDTSRELGRHLGGRC